MESNEAMYTGHCSSQGEDEQRDYLATVEELEGRGKTIGRVKGYRVLLSFHLRDQHHVGFG